MAIATKSNTKSNKTTKTAKAVELTEAGANAVKAFNKAKAAEAKAKAQKALAEEIIRQELGESVEGMIDGLTAVKIVSGSNTHFDRELLMVAYREAFDATLRTTAYTYVKTL
jgi:aminopeptidase N